MTFGPIMTIKGSHVSLRPIDLKDIVQDTQPSRDKVLQNGQFAHMLDDKYLWYAGTEVDPDRLVWGIYVLRDGKQNLIGATGFERIGDKELNPYFKSAISSGIISHSDDWVTGIMSECQKVRTWYALTQPIGLERIISGAYETYPPGLNALRDMGYVELFQERNMMFRNGEMSSRICLELISPHDRTWSTWWHGDTIPARYKQARKKTIETLEWAEANIELQ